MSYEDIESSMDIMPMDEVSAEIISTVTITPSISPAEDRIRDYELIRSVLGDAMNKGMQALDGSLLAANETKNPRAFEVAGMLTKTVSGVCADLMNLHKSMSDINIKEDLQEDDPDDPSVFTGDAASLISILEDADEKKSLQEE